MDRIYLDYAASAPLAPEAKSVIEKFAADFNVGNPSSQHTEGRKAQAMLDRAQTTLAAVFGVQPTEVVFTSGATEANNAIINGVLQGWRDTNPDKPHVIFSTLCHSSVRESLLYNEQIERTILTPNSQGVIDADDVTNAIKDTTALVCLPYIQNELGTIQPVQDVGRMIQELRIKNKELSSSNHNSKFMIRDSNFPVFHVDAVQAFPYLNTHIDHVNADAMTFSGHKYGSLAGIGALVVRHTTPLLPFIRGGAQQWAKRAGTENILGAQTMAAVVDNSDAHREELTNHVRGLQQLLEKYVVHSPRNYRLIGDRTDRAPHITYLWHESFVDDAIIAKLDLAGFAVSKGSACSSGAHLPSGPLISIGYSRHDAHGGLRISYGRFTTPLEIELFCEALESAIN